MSCISQINIEAKISLLSSLFSKNYFLWIGSGFSYNFGYGSWDDVLKEIANKIEYPLELNVSNPLKAAELLCSYSKQSKGISEYEFNALVAESLLTLKKEDIEPDWIRRFRAFSPNMIVTTNWDNQLENIYDNMINVVVRKDKTPKVSNTGKNLFKIHGDVGRPSSIVVTQSQYFAFQREDTYLNRKIYTLFSEGSPIFIGYSLTDPNIGFLYDEVYAHLGEEKPPAFMVIHPSVNDKVLEETRLLFKGKNIHLIKAEIGEFLEDLSKEFKEFKKSNKRFFLENQNIEERLRELIKFIIDSKAIQPQDILDRFNNNDSRHQAIKAFVEILSNQFLYPEFGGELLAPENIISYREIDQIIYTIVTMTNESNYPDDQTREDFYKAVFKSCAKSDGVWDFYTAREPFLNILRISPRPQNSIFNERIEHIIEVLRWSGSDELGKCWATWDVFCKQLDWLNEVDIEYILLYLEKDDYLRLRKSDKKWLSKLKECKNSTEEQRQRIDQAFAI